MLSLLGTLEVRPGSEEQGSSQDKRLRTGSVAEWPRMAPLDLEGLPIDLDLNLSARGRRAPTAIIPGN